jgi:FtsP/CotA-like multicopper oxidase with cupredoxin domain
MTQDPIEQGESFTYEVHVPDAGMFWYHPHVREDVQQDLGLYGNLHVTSPDPEYYGPATARRSSSSTTSSWTGRARFPGATAPRPTPSWGASATS